MKTDKEKEQEIKIKTLSFELALEKAQRTIDRINELGERAKLIEKLSLTHS